MGRPREADADAGEPLIYPRRLNANQREIAARYLARVPTAQRQSVLDELEGRLRAEQQGAKPVYDELRYLYHLCSQVNAGGFQANLGLKVLGEREDRARAAEQRRQAAQASQDAQRRKAQRPRTGESPLAEARRLLGRASARRTKACER